MNRRLENGTCFGCFCWPCVGKRCPEYQRARIAERLDRITIETSQGTVTIHTSEALSRNEVRAYSFDAAMLKLLDECNVCGNQLASTEGHRPGCSRDNRFDEADEWYAAEVERMKERAPA